MEFLEHLRTKLDAVRRQGLYKSERVLTTRQGGRVGTLVSPDLINLCANNYLGLAGEPEVAEAAKAALDRWGYGLSSVRFICGTQEVHKSLENRLSEFLGMEDTILYSSCFDAATGLFETLLGGEDAIISDALNHACIIDGIRLCKARRFVYKNNDMVDLEAKLQEASDARYRIIATDGVFSMDGIIASLQEICDLAERYDAMVMVDDSHAVGFVGEEGRGTHEHCKVMERVDIITGTLGKALGGASGGYTSGRREIVEMLRQRSRPYLFSNSLAPVIAATSLAVLAMLENANDRRLQLWDNAAWFREQMTAEGFDLVPGEHPIIPVMMGDAPTAVALAEAVLKEGVYVIPFSFPVVPKGKARIRTQMSAAHSRDDLEKTVAAFVKARESIGLS